MAIRKKEGEDFSQAKVASVILKLEAENPITKKQACDMLGMSYNPSRLSKIIDEHKEKIERDKEIRKNLRSKPVSIAEQKMIVEMYLMGDSISTIVESTYRSLNTIKTVFKKYNLPEKQPKDTYILLTPEQLGEGYKKGDLVYSAKYNCPALVSKVLKDETYRVWLLGNYGQYAYQPGYEFADLRKAQKVLMLNIRTKTYNEALQEIYQAFQQAKKVKKDV